MQNPFNNASPTPESQPDTRFTYFPAVSVGAGDVGTSHTEVTNALAGQAGIDLKSDSGMDKICVSKLKFLYPEAFR